MIGLLVLISFLIMIRAFLQWIDDNLITLNPEKSRWICQEMDKLRKGREQPIDFIDMRGLLKGGKKPQPPPKERIAQEKSMEKLLKGWGRPYNGSERFKGWVKQARAVIAEQEKQEQEEMLTLYIPRSVANFTPEEFKQIQEAFRGKKAILKWTEANAAPAPSKIANITHSFAFYPKDLKPPMFKCLRFFEYLKEYRGVEVEVIRDND